MNLKKTKLEILKSIESSADISFVYIETDGESSTMHGNFSDKAAADFMKHIAKERPNAYRHFKKWKIEKEE